MAKEKDDVKEEEEEEEKEDEKDVEENAEESKEDDSEEKEEEKSEDEDEAVKRLSEKFLKMVSEGIEKEKQDTKKGKMFAEKKVTKDDIPKDKKVGEFIKALFRNDHIKLELLSEGVAADGGFLVPEEWRDEIVMYLNDEAVVRSKATVIPMTTDQMHIPQLLSRPNVYWRSELATKTTSTASYHEITLTPYSLAAIVGLSNELVSDASVGLPSGIISHITQLLADAVAQEEDRVFINGTGVGQPTGLTTYGFTAVNAANTMTGDHLIDAYYTCPQAYRKNGYWIMNSRCISAIRAFKDTTNRYIFDNALNPEGFPTLLGRPVLEQNDLASATILYGDLKYYYIGQREGVSVRVSDEATVASQSAFERNLTWVRVEERIDAECALTQAFVQVSNTGVS